MGVEKLWNDVNAAKNIYCLGQAIISGLCTVKMCLQEALSFRGEQFTKSFQETQWPEHFNDLE